MRSLSASCTLLTSSSARALASGGNALATYSSPSAMPIWPLTVRSTRFQRGSICGWPPSSFE